MEPITRRDFVSIAGAGILVGAVPEELKSQENVPQVHRAEGRKTAKMLLPDLTGISTKVAETDEYFFENYFWIDDHTLLFLNLSHNARGIFRGVLVDTTTGQTTLAQQFNDKNGALLLGQDSGIDGGNNREFEYIPPKATLSPDGQWLLWSTTSGNPDFHWVAATLDGKRHLWNHVADPTSDLKHVDNDGYWLRDNTGWVEFVKKYASLKYTLTCANIYHLGNPSPVRTLPVEGLEDGSDVGVMQDGRVMMYHPPDNQEMTTQATFSLVSLEGATAKIERLMVPIPQTRFVEQVIMSPQGDHLAWVLNEGKDGSVIYVSHLDGKELHPIGTAPLIEIRPGRYSSPAKVRWLPDGSRLSYRYNKGIHTVAV